MDPVREGLRRLSVNQFFIRGHDPKEFGVLHRGEPLLVGGVRLSLSIFAPIRGRLLDKAARKDRGVE